MEIIVMRKLPVQIQMEDLLVLVKMGMMEVELLAQVKFYFF